MSQKPYGWKADWGEAESLEELGFIDWLWDGRMGWMIEEHVERLWKDCGRTQREPWGSEA